MKRLTISFTDSFGSIFSCSFLCRYFLFTDYFPLRFMACEKITHLL